MAVRIQHPPELPLLLWDGDCGFCGRSARWLERQSGNAVQYCPYQEALADYPELCESELEQAVHLIEPDGSVCHSAAAISRVLATQPRYAWLDRWYRRNRLFAALSEWGYRRVANNRSLISSLTRNIGS